MNHPVITRLTARLFGSPILQNNIRGEVVEETVAMALEPEWEHCAGDWGPCDLRHPTTGIRIQVKQSAARQTWDASTVSRTNPRFSIAEKTGRYEDGGAWIEGASRNAEIFIFGWHPHTDKDADHRDARQWIFYVVPETALPKQKSIALSAIAALAAPTEIGGLASTVEAVSAALRDSCTK